MAQPSRPAGAAIGAEADGMAAPAMKDGVMVQQNAAPGECAPFRVSPAER
ncbi:hypothetical protein [Chitiniphilus shinanonensis]